MALFGVEFARLNQLLPVFAANYVKRFLEHVYDSAFETDIGRRLTAMGRSKKYAAEFGLNLLAAFFSDRLAENSGLKKFVKEIAIDAAPEVSKRLINGAREEILASVKTGEEKEIAQVLLGLEDGVLFSLLDWLYEKPVAELMTVLGRLSLMSAEQIARLMNFSVENREKFFGILNPKSKLLRYKEDGRGILGIVADDINRLNEKLENKEAGR